MKMMARICFDADEAGQRAIAALREQGFAVLTHSFPEEPAHIFAEATKDVGDGDEHELSGALLDKVAHIVGAAGSVDDAGLTPINHEPFQYETAWWRGVVAD